jgi:quercetin dioxygenase-like cupin family protein
MTTPCQDAGVRWQEADISRIGGFESQLLELGEMVCARHQIPAGFDSAPLYRGLPDNMCPCEHWCYLATGRMHYRFADGETLAVKAGEAFHLRAGHLAEVLEDADLIEFTPSGPYRLKQEHTAQRVIENPITGEQILFRRTAAETDGELLEMDDYWARTDHQTPEHVHPAMEERWDVIAGEVRFEIGGVTQTATAGDTVVAPPGTPHCACNVGPEPAHLRIQMRPALRWQEFVERLFALDASEPDSVATLMREFRSEIALARPR